MATVEIKQPKITVIEYNQEKTDEDYGSCLWARFYFDEKNYTLQIESDCGTYGYGWIPTPDTESFLHLMSRLNQSYLLGKISSESVVDGDATYKNVREYIKYEVDSKDSVSEYDDIENACYYSSVSEVYDALFNILDNSSDRDYIDEGTLFECSVTTYPNNAKKIVEVFNQHIKPKIRKILKEIDDERPKNICKNN